MKVKVKILKSTMADKQFVKAGEIAELSAKDAAYLVAIKKAELVQEAEKAPVIEEPVKSEEPPKAKKKK